MSVFYKMDGAPVHSVLLMHSREQALSYPTGGIRLALCEKCGFISNVAFDPSLHEYSQEYEATQSYSPTFNSFNRRLAQHLVETYDLHHRSIIEIGCGHGEFLILLCEMGPNRGVGFDPAYIEDRIQHPAKERIRFIPDFYSEQYAEIEGDFIVCKMTLEHIPNTDDFLATVRRSIGDRVGTRVFFQIPNASYVLRDVAFWDVYYEHCSYFSRASLATLFMRNNFVINNLFTDYDDQYLMIEAQAAAGKADTLESLPGWIADVKVDVMHFASKVGGSVERWRASLEALTESNRKIVLWGSGSKAVAFLTTLRILDEVEYVVDINPNKEGTFMAGTGQEIVGPAFLQEYEPDVVIVMNPVYTDEIRATLADLGLEPRIMTVESPTLTDLPIRSEALGN